MLCMLLPTQNTNLVSKEFSVFINYKLHYLHIYLKP